MTVLYESAEKMLDNDIGFTLRNRWAIPLGGGSRWSPNETYNHFDTQRSLFRQPGAQLEMSDRLLDIR